MKKRILFVCTGNTCRSVMAELLLKKMISVEAAKNPASKNILENLEAGSAGIAPVPGMNTAPGTLRALKEEGIDATGHRPSRLTKTDIDESDAVIVMEERQKKEAERIAGSPAGKIRHINEFLDDYAGDVPDPFGHSIEIYAECRDRIKKALSGLMEKIITEEF